MAFGTLVDARTVRDHLDDADWLVVDCRHDLADFEAGARAYASGHVPGAFFAHVERDLSGAKTGTNGRHPLPEAGAFAAVLRELGANDDTQIVAYDAGGDMFAARFWFLARWIGHERVAVLDGGLRVWEHAGYPVTRDLPRAASRGTLTVHPPLDAAIDARAVRDLLDDGAAALVDARSPDRYAGTFEPIDPVAGHIPGARNHFFKRNFAEDGRWKSPDELRVEFAPYGDASQVVHYCGSGVSAAANLLSMHVAGLTAARIYPGSWSEWCADPQNPVENPEGGISLV